MKSCSLLKTLTPLLFHGLLTLNAYVWVILEKKAEKASWDLEKTLCFEKRTGSHFFMITFGYRSSRYLLYFVFACHLFAFMHTGRPKVVRV
jgi:hypothetical protein